MHIIFQKVAETLLIKIYDVQSKGFWFLQALL